jgi:hypothetical protein
MLLYRQYDPERNVSNKDAHAALPSALETVMQEENDAFDRRHEAAEHEKQCIQIKCTFDGTEQTAKIHSSKTIRQVTAECAGLFGFALEGEEPEEASDGIPKDATVVPADCVRIRGYRYV